MKCAGQAACPRGSCGSWQRRSPSPFWGQTTRSNLAGTPERQLGNWRVMGWEGEKKTFLVHSPRAVPVPAVPVGSLGDTRPLLGTAPRGRATAGGHSLGEPWLVPAVPATPGTSCAFLNGTQGPCHPLSPAPRGTEVPASPCFGIWGRLGASPSRARGWRGAGARRRVLQKLQTLAQAVLPSMRAASVKLRDKEGIRR